MLLHTFTSTFTSPCALPLQTYPQCTGCSGCLTAAGMLGQTPATSSTSSLSYDPQWSLGDWGSCSQSCGGGTRSRTVVCSPVGLPSSSSLSDAACQAAGAHCSCVVHAVLVGLTMIPCSSLCWCMAWQLCRGSVVSCGLRAHAASAAGSSMCYLLPACHPSQWHTVLCSLP